MSARLEERKLTSLIDDFPSIRTSEHGAVLPGARSRIETALRVVDQGSFGLNSAMNTTGEPVNRNRTIINLAYILFPTLDLPS